MGDGFLKRLERKKTRVDLRASDLVRLTPEERAQLPADRTVNASKIIERPGAALGTPDLSGGDGSTAWWLQTKVTPSPQVDALVPAARLKLNEIRSGQGSISDNNLLGSIRAAVGAAATDLSHELRFSAKDIQDAITELQRFLLGKGPIQDLYDDEQVTDIFLEGHNRIRCLRGGRVYETPFRFRSQAEFEGYLASLLQGLGRVLNESTPIVSGTIADGYNSRVHVMHPSRTGRTELSAVIRIPRLKNVTLFELLSRATLPATLGAWLTEVVSSSDANVLVTGPPRSGKTTLSSALLGTVGSDERVIVIEQNPEIGESGVPFERMLGTGAQQLALVDAALARSPGRLVLGDLNGEFGGAALLRAFESMARGSLGVLTAGSPFDAIWRLLDSSNSGISSDTTQLRLCQAVHLIIGMREIDGSPCVTSVCELHSPTAGESRLTEFVRFEGVVNGKRTWRLLTRTVPILDLLLERGVELQVGLSLLPPIEHEEVRDEGE